MKSHARRARPAVLPAALATSIAAIATSFASPAAAQERADTFPLREVVVTATRLPTPLDAVPAAVTVITAEELRARGIRFVADALQTVPGAALASGGAHGAITGLFLRGGESDYVQVLIDGVQVNEPGGSYDFAHLSTHDIDRIEIVRGPVSVLYGTDAVAGVIQIFTREGAGTPTLRASLETGRFAKDGPTLAGETATGNAGALAYDASLSGEAAGVRYTLGAARFDTDGLYLENSDYVNNTLSARASWRSGAAAAARRGGRFETGVPTGTDAAASVRWTDHRYNFPTDGAGRIVDLNQFNTGTSLAAGFDAGHFIRPSLEARFSAQLHRNETGFDNQPDSPADTLGSYAAESEGRTLRRALDARANVHLPRAIMTFGGAASWQEGRSHYISYSQWGPFESESDDERSNRAVYAQLVANPVSALTVTLGGRLDDSDMFGGYATYRAGANVRVAPGITLRAATASAFKEPTFYENFAAGFVTGNPDLDPERSRSAELGAVLSHRATTVSVTAYRQRFTDMIQYDSRPRDQRAGDPNYYNLAAASADGVEVEVAGPLTRRVDVRAGYNFLDSDVQDAGIGADRAFLHGQRLLRRPAHAGNVVVSARPTYGTRVALTGRFVGDRDDLDFADDWQGERIALASYATLGIAGEVLAVRAPHIGDFAVTLRVDNVFDARYEDIRNFTARGRALYVGVRTGN